MLIYVILGSSGLYSIQTSTLTNEDDAPSARAKAETLVYPGKDLKCADHSYDIHVLSTSPLVIYVDGFLSKDEARHLVDIRYARFSSCRYLKSVLSLETVQTNGKSQQFSMKA